MADTKISALTGATTPLAGTEVLPIVQSGTTKKVSIASLTAGRDVDMAKAKPTDNVVMAAGKGIDFSANSGGVLSMFKESTYTPTLTGFTITGTAIASGKYTRIGNVVFVTITISGMTNISNAAYTGYITLPFAPANFSGLCSMNHSTFTNSVGGIVITNDVFYPPSWSSTSNTVTVNAIYVC